MAKKVSRDLYGQSVIDALNKGEPDAVERAVWFLRNRLTDAAKAGCHHCDEGERGAPCHWCGLRTRR